jgi:hypothetical protein
MNMGKGGLKVWKMHTLETIFVLCRLFGGEACISSYGVMEYEG